MLYFPLKQFVVDLNILLTHFCRQEQAKKRSEFAKQTAALKSQLEYETSRDTLGTDYTFDDCHDV